MNFDQRKFGIQPRRLSIREHAAGLAHIPWDDPTCAVRSPFLQIDPIRIRRSDALLSAEHMKTPCLFGRIDYREHQINQLVGGITRLTLRDVMLACAVLPQCAGISVDLKNTRPNGYRELIRDDGYGGACQGGHQDWDTGPGKLWYAPRLTPEDPLYDPDPVLECGNRCVAWFSRNRGWLLQAAKNACAKQAHATR